MRDLPLILPSMTMAEIAKLCACYSTEDSEVYARIVTVNGHPVGYLARASVPHEFRRQAGGL